MKNHIVWLLLFGLATGFHQPLRAQPANYGGNYGSPQTQPRQPMRNDSAMQPNAVNRQIIEPAAPITRAKIHTELAASYFEIGNMAVALEELRIASEADPDYAPAYSVRGLVHASLREYEKAEEQFRKALNLSPNDPEINNNYGWFLCHTGKERESIDYFLNALKSPLYETPDRAYANAGRCAKKAGDLEGAEQYLTQAIRMSKDGALMARFLLAELYYQRNNLQPARQLANQVLKTIANPSPAVIWLTLRIERKLGNRSEEGALAAQLRSRYPDSREYQEFLKGNFE